MGSGHLGYSFLLLDFLDDLLLAVTFLHVEISIVSGLLEILSMP